MAEATRGRGFPDWAKPPTKEAIARCYRCGSHKTRVVDSRGRAEGDQIRRRRACYDCGARWTTYEVHERDIDGVIDNVFLLQGLTSDQRTLVRELIMALRGRR